MGRVWVRWCKLFIGEQGETKVILETCTKPARLLKRHGDYL